MPIETTSNADLASQILSLVGQDSGPAPGAVTVEVFRRCTRDQLLEMARRLGLTGVSKLSKEALAARVLAAYEDLSRPVAGAGIPRAPTPDVDVAADEEAAFHKFDLGPSAEEGALPQ